MTNATRQFSRAPDWDLVPFPVHCARCGHDLHGATEPRCPACNLEFTWAEAVPLKDLACAHCDYRLFGLRETRCPECGEPFTWQDALTRHRRRAEGLFEYRYARQPVRSLLRTLRRTCRPVRFWRGLDLHTPAETQGLTLFVIVALFIFPIVLAFCDYLTAVAQSVINLMFMRGGWSQWANDPLQMLFWVFSLPRGVSRLFDDTACWLCFGLTWCLASLCALLVFRQSMRRCRIRSVHVFRVWAYAVVAPLVLAPAVFDLAYVVIYLTAWPMSPRYYLDITPLCLPLFALFVCVSVRSGYRHHLRMDHSAAIAIVSQCMAAMAAALASGLILGDLFWAWIGGMLH